MRAIPLSPYSLLFWHNHQLNPESSEYNISFTQQIQGKFNRQRFQQSLLRFLNDHPLFTSHIVINNTEPCWQSHTATVTIIDYDHASQLADLIKIPFSLTDGPLHRILLQQITPQEYILTLVFHHIVVDGNQFKSLINTISHYYNDPQFSRAGNWQEIEQKNSQLRALAEQLDNAALKQFWQQLVTSEAEHFSLPFISEQQTTIDDKRAITEVRFTLNKQDWPEITRYEPRPFILFSQVWATLMTRCAAHHDVTLRYPLAIRSANDLQLGAQINTALLPIRLEDSSTLNQLCQSAEQTLRQKDPEGHYCNQLPAEKILHYSGCRNLPLAFAQTDLRTTAFHFEHCKVTPLHDYYCDAGDADLALEYEELAEGWLFRLRYRSALFVPEQVSRCGEYFMQLLANALAAPDTPLLSLPLLNQQQIAELLPAVAATSPFIETSMAERFKHIVEHYPEHTALSYAGSTLSYRQLNQLADNLAVLVQAALPDTAQSQPIAIYCDKSPVFIVALLAVLKAGHLYMPIATATDSANKRTQYQIEHTATPLMLVATPLHSQAAALISQLQTPPRLLAIDLNTLQHSNSVNLLAEIKQPDAAIIFTSGTTGKPKGVVISQSDIIELVTNTNHIPFTAEDACLFLASPIFDAATLEIWGALLNGGKLVIPPSTQVLASNVSAFRHLLSREKVTVACVTRTLFDTLYLLDQHLFDSVKYVMVGGEALTAAIMVEWMSRPERPEKVFNGFGPTECTTMSACYELPANFTLKSVPIGKATDGRELYVLNQHLQLQPQGATGELYIGGRGLARGYFNNPQQNAASFMSNPFHAGRLYKTGDQVKQLPDGNLLFCGRNDGQVKIRGHRIELSEIESVINSCPGVQQSAVVALPKEEGGQLAAWYVVKSDETLTRQQLESYLSTRLPSYMMPRFYTPLSAIPITSSGKLDVRALSKPQREAQQSSDTSSSPASALLLQLTRSLLNDESITLQQHFYRAGGDSIQAIQLIAGLREAGYNVLLSDPGHYATLAEFASQLTLSQPNDAPAPTVENQDYPVTPLQAGLLTWTVQHPDDDAYFLQQVMEYRCAIDLTHYYAAWDLVRKRYPALRTRFNWQQGTFRQQILPWQAQGAQGLQLIDISKHSDEEQQRQLKGFIQQQRTQPVDLEVPGTLSLTLFKLADDRFQLIKSEHHAITDGWSNSNVWQQLHHYYDSLMAGEQPDAEPEHAWLDALRWQQEHQAQSRDFWQQQAKTFNAPNNISWLLDKPHQITDFQQVRHAQCAELTLESERVNPLKQYCQQAGITLNVLLQFAWHKLLHIYTQDVQTLVGTVLSGRNLPINGITDSAGLFINTLPLAVNWQEGAQISDQLQQIHHSIVSMNQHHGYPLAELQSGNQRLFQSLLVFENYPYQPAAQGLSAHAQSLAIIEKLDFPLVLVALMRDERLILSLRYDGMLLSTTRAMQLVEHITTLMSQACAQAQQSHETLSLAAALTPVDIPTVANETLLARFAAMVKRYPQRPAIIWQQQTISYQQLDHAANALAQQLYSHISAEEPVIILMDKQPQWLVAMLAIIKAGGCYLPLAPDIPPLRVRMIARDAQVRQIITDEQYRALFESDLVVTCLSERFSALSASASPPDKHDACAAAIFYTSGTSGTPKGVVIEQDALRELVVDTNYIAIQPDDQFIFLANPAFDAASFEIWGALLNGASLLIPENTQTLISDVTQLQTLLQQRPVTIMWLTRSLFDALYLANNQLFNSLRYLLVGGEALTPALMRQLAAQASRPLHILNGYGPTECTTFTTTYAIVADEPQTTIPLGRAVNGRQLWILDQHAQPVPAGAPGELYVGGIGLARGYLNQSELSAQRFIYHPQLQTRLYRTGDRVRKLADGNLEYLGRIDNQVKIRGFRIEPDEIAMALLSLPGVQQSAVTLWQHAGQKQLAAWLVALPGHTLDIVSLRRQLAGQLPDYMIPASFNLLTQLPLTANGKLDVQSLPTPVQSTDDDYCAPRNALEQQLCAAWQQVLQLDKVSIHDNFFRMGGDSIQSILLVTELRKAGFHLDASAINRAPTVARMAQVLQTQSAQINQEQQAISGACPLLPIQQWFFKQNFAQPHHWNQAFMLRLPANIDAAQLQVALEQLSRQHDMLRAHYHDMEQWIVAEDEFKTPLLSEIDARAYSSAELQQQLSALQADFDYQHGPLWRAAIIRCHPQGSDRLWLAFHHLIIDVVSWRILAQNLLQLVARRPLSAKTTSYRRWAHVQQDYFLQHPDDLLWWQQAVKTHGAHAELFAQAPPQQLTLRFTVQQTQQLLRQAGQAWNTQINDLLLTALAQALTETSGNKQHRVMLEGHGREPWDSQIDLTQTVGWFTSMYPVHLTVEHDLAATIVATKERLRSIPAKGIGYGIACQQGLLHDTLPGVAFNYLGVLATSQEAWSIIADQCGDTVNTANRSAFALTLNGAVSEQQLTFYIDSQLPEAQTQCLVDAFQQALNDVIVLCCTRQPQRTASDFGPLAISPQRLAQLQQHYVNLTAILPATPLQQGMIYHTLAHPNDDAYRVQQLMCYDCALNPEHYQQAWQLAVKRFPILRTVFDWQDGTMLQLVLTDAPIAAANFNIIDLSTLLAEQQQAQISLLQQQDRQHPFALDKPESLRLLLIKLHDRGWSVLKSQHHVICDGWSEPLVLDAVHQFYEALQRGVQPQIVEQQSWLEAQHHLYRFKQKSARFWQQEKLRLTVANDLRALATEKLAPLASEERAAASYQLSFSAAQTIQLRSRCAALGITLNALVQFAWHKLIQIYSQDEQTQVGTVLSGRDLPVADIKQCVGPFINTLPLAVIWQEEHRCIDVLLAIQQKIAELNSHTNISLTELQTESQALFNSLLVYENYPQIAPRSGIASAWRMEAAFEKLDYPLALLAWETAESLTLQLNYFTAWLSPALAEQRLQQLQDIMQQCMAHPENLHDSISLAGPVPQPVTLPTGPVQTLLARFVSMVQRYPDNIALSDDSGSLSYRQLDQYSNQLAREILARYHAVHGKPLPHETPVALLLDKSNALVIGMLAILKAGGCYVPISTEYPDERIEFILAETATPLLLSTQPHPESNLPCLLLNDDLSANSIAALPFSADARATGAIIFTSGTTGVPKGVLIAQQAMAELVVDNPYISISDKDAFMLLSSPVFDAATFEIWGALLNGAKLVIPPSTQELASDTVQFKALLQQQGISILWVTRSLFDLLYLRQRDLFNSLRYLLVGGEALSADIMRQLASQAERPQHIINGYGPTECTTFTTTYEISAIENGASIPIGKAIAGRQLYVLNRLMQPVPQGAPGELYVGGSGVSRGYINRPVLTARQFVTNPFGEDILYKTGDWVRYRADGGLEYLGRKDQQVKIRGFRVELDEIACRLQQLSGVEHAVIQMREVEGQPFICAWCIMQAGQRFDANTLLNALERSLPDYMLPSAIMAIDNLPVTVNGKLDSSRLPEPQRQLDDNYCMPRNELECTIAKVWQQILNCAPVSIHANFFRIGGDSIQSILVTTELRKRGINCSTRDIFTAKTIAHLAALLAQQTQPQITLSEQGPLSGQFALLPIQQWFNALQLNHPHWFNQAFTLALPADATPERLQGCLQQLLMHHDMLRARFDVEGHQITAQRYLADDTLVFTTFDRATLHDIRQLEDQCSEWQQHFSLQTGPLYRFVYLYDSQSTEPPVLFCAFHHLIIDAVSWRILASDLQTLYAGDALESKATSYRQWQQCVAEYGQRNAMQREFWQQQIAQQPDYWRGYNHDGARQRVTQQLSAAMTDQLLHQVHQVYHTEVTDFLLTALSHALRRWHGEAASWLTLEGHGREHITDQADISRTLGWFTTLFPLCLRTQASEVQSLRSIKEQLRAVPDKGFGFSTLQYDTLNLPAISFNYLGQISSTPQPWSILPYGRGEQNSPENASHNLLDIVVSVVSNQLLLNIDTALPAAVSQQISADFLATLERLITHCHRQKQAGNSWFSPADFPSCDISMAMLDDLQNRMQLENIYPATDTQRELLYFNRLNPDFQIDQNIVRIDGEFDADCMIQAWQLAAQRYDVLRTGYSDAHAPGRPLAFVCQQLPFPVALETWRPMATASLEEKLRQRMLNERLQYMPTDKPGLMRVVIVHISATQHYMLQTFNHVLIDGWSLNNILTTLLADYQCLLHGETIDVTPMSFAAFPCWLQRCDNAAADRFWSVYLQDAPRNQRLPCEDVPTLDLRREKRMRKLARSLTEGQTSALNRFAASSGYTPNQITQLAWMQALAHRLDSDDVVIGTTMSERPAEIENVAKMVGLFVASPVLRLCNIRQQNASTLLAHIAATQPDRQQYAFHELNHYSPEWIPTSPFGSLFVFESMPKAQLENLPFSLTPMDNVSGSNHQTVLCLIPEAQQLFLSLFYDASELSERSVSELCDEFIYYIDVITRHS